MQGTPDPRYRSYKWKMLRGQLLKERDRCEGPCRGFRPSKYADHIVEVQDGGDFFDVLNIQTLCEECHGRKTAAEKARREGRPYRAPEPKSCPDPKTGLPTNPAHWWNKGT